MDEKTFLHTEPFESVTVLFGANSGANFPPGKDASIVLRGDQRNGSWCLLIGTQADDLR